MIRFDVASWIMGRLLVILGTLMLLPGAVSAFYREPEGVISFALTSLLTMVAGMFLVSRGHRDEPSNQEAFVVVVVGWGLVSLFGALPFMFQGIDPVSAVFESISGFSATGATVLNEHNAQGYYILNQTIAESSLAVQLAHAVEGLLISLATADPDLANRPLQGGAGMIGINAVLGLAGHMAIPEEPTYFGLLFWRSFSQLLGGMGIILLFVAIMPQLGVAGRQLFMAESVGPSKDTIVPRAKQTARLLWEIYMLLVGAEVVLLLMAGMPLYDSACTAFSSLATGGFSPRSDSIAFYASPLIEAVIVVFIIFGATSFPLHYKLIRGDFKSWLHDSELRFFLLILAIATIVLMFWGGLEGDFPGRLRLAAFQVVSFMGTCGFVNNADYDTWSSAAKLALIMVMLIGGCAGSTAGGIKVARLQICIKYALFEMRRMIHHKAVVQVRMGGKLVGEEILRSILFYSFFYLATFLVLSLALAMASAGQNEADVLAVISGIASCMSGVGPGFGILTFDWSAVSSAGKIIGSFAMFIGRLEVMPVILLLTPEFWRR
ncbi:MAG: potassium transporter [Methanosaeta sp. PtaU1.Bin028]|nr:MAG: potassium transporter [Methanosaeta sp. PtaU1.Bin028]